MKKEADRKITELLCCPQILSCFTNSLPDSTVNTSPSTTTVTSTALYHHRLPQHQPHNFGVFRFSSITVKINYPWICHHKSSSLVYSVSHRVADDDDDTTGLTATRFSSQTSLPIDFKTHWLIWNNLWIALIVFSNPKLM